MMSAAGGVGMRGVALVLLGLLLCGCAGVVRVPEHLGIRPNEPPPVANAAKACDEYVKYITYAQDLQEAYHSRASQNRGWIYVAGLLGLGAAAASGGLAVAGAAGVGTLGLLSISGGASAGAFATLDNSRLSSIYTISANKVDKALAAAPYGIDDVATCKQELNKLRNTVSEARIELEGARTDSAKEAVMRASDQVGKLQELKKELDKALK